MVLLPLIPSAAAAAAGADFRSLSPFISPAPSSSLSPRRWQYHLFLRSAAAAAAAPLRCSSPSPSSPRRAIAPPEHGEIRSGRVVFMENPGVEFIAKAQIGEEGFGFRCEIGEGCSHEIADVHPDTSFDSEIKHYKENGRLIVSEADLKTKRLFVSGLSFYTSEKTLRAVFESYGELVYAVKVMMDKISRRSKGYAFLEYETVEAASTALKEMNGKIVNGWTIAVDVARANPPKRRPSA